MFSILAGLMFLLLCFRKSSQKLVLEESVELHGHGHEVCTPLVSVSAIVEIDVHILYMLDCKRYARHRLLTP
jgi:hypothetical protein